MSGTREGSVAIVRRYFAAWDACDLDALDDLIADDYIDHAAYAGEAPGREGVKAFFVLWRTAFPDFSSTIEDQIAEGDKVVTRWTLHGTHRGDYHGIAPTGRRVTMPAISIARIAGGKIVEEWYLGDELGLLRQIGGIPESGAAAE
jgi:steroid delta-isomerase-like uncharacterized protein